MQCHRIHVPLIAFAVYANWVVVAEAAREPAIAPALLLYVDANSDYQEKLREYLQARERYENEAKAYWALVADKRRSRNAKRRNGEPIALEDYVLMQPPVYSGPPKPIDPLGAQQEPPPVEKYVPVKADFLNNAAQYFQFVPQQPETEIQYKRAYAKIAFEVGLTKEQVVRIYAFEAGGDGTYDVQAGLENPKLGGRAISTALGYNQLLNANSIGLMAEQGDQFISRLKKRSLDAGSRSTAPLEKKIGALEGMIEFCRSVPDDWSEHENLAKTPKGIGVHAVLLDIDIGPLLQAQKVLQSVLFAAQKRLQKVLTAAELEMMNLTGDGNGFDIVTMPEDMRDKVPTANFFQPVGYERNPVAIRHNTVAKLLAATDAIMDRESASQGAKGLEAAFLAAEKARR